MALTLILPQDVINDLEKEREEKERAAREAALIQRNSVQTRQHYDETSDTLMVERVQDAEPALDFAEAMRNAHPRNGYSHDRSMRHVAEVPLVIWEEWIRQGMDPRDNRAIRKRIQDRDFSRFLTVDKL